MTHGISEVADAETGGLMEVGIAKVCEAIGKGVAKLTYPEREPQETAEYEQAIANVQAKARNMTAHARRDPDKLDQADMLTQYADEYSKAWEYAGKLPEVENAETKLRNKKAKDAGEPSGFFKRHFGKKKDA